MWVHIALSLPDTQPAKWLATPFLLRITLRLVWLRQMFKRRKGKGGTGSQSDGSSRPTLNPPAPPPVSPHPAPHANARQRSSNAFKSVCERAADLVKSRVTRIAPVLAVFTRCLFPTCEADVLILPEFRSPSAIRILTFAQHPFTCNCAILVFAQHKAKRARE